MHLNTHVNTKPYLCPNKSCKKRFIDKAQIKYHMKSHYANISKPEFDILFSNYMEMTKDKIDMLITSRQKEMEIKTINKEAITPQLPKFIRTKNSYDIVRNVQDANENEDLKLDLQQSNDIKTECLKSNSENAQSKECSSSHLSRKRVLKVENPDDCKDDQHKTKTLLEKYVTAKLINSLK